MLDALDSGVTSQLDLREWPSAEELQDIMPDMAETCERLRKAKHRRSQLEL